MLFNVFSLATIAVVCMTSLLVMVGSTETNGLSQPFKRIFTGASYGLYSFNSNNGVSKDAHALGPVANINYGVQSERIYRRKIKFSRRVLSLIQRKLKTTAENTATKGKTVTNKRSFENYDRENEKDENEKDENERDENEKDEEETTMR